MKSDLIKLLNPRTLGVGHWSGWKCASTTTGTRHAGASRVGTQKLQGVGNPTNSAEMSAGRTARKTLVYLAQKQKEEILALHDEDPVRWTATVLATRFGAPRENVQMLLRLGQERKRRQKYINSLPGDQKSNIEKLKSQSVDAWFEISSEPSLSSRRTRTPYSRSQSSPQLSTPSSRPPKSVDELRSVAFATEENIDDDDPSATKTPAEGDIDKEIDGTAVEESEWSKNLDHLCANAELDTTRRWSFAFIEVGRTKKVRRGVWLRVGQSGKLRIADEEERKLFLNAVNTRDSKAFPQSQ